MCRRKLSITCERNWKMEVYEILRKTLKYAEDRDYRGYDPYDALNSPILRAMGFHKYLRIAFIQAFKRSPINFRPIFLVRPGHNPKGLGLFAGVYAGLGDREKFDYVKGLLLKYSSKGYSGYAWGYNFPWQSRVFYVPPYTPTIVNTTFIAHALLDAFEKWEEREFLDIARSSCDFILKDLNRRVEEDFQVFSYTPIDRLMVFNASLLGAGLLARVGRITGETHLIDEALKAGMFAVRFQNEDGSWYYGLGSDSMKYIDNFHTAFNLLSLMEILSASEDRRIRESFEKGLEYWMKHMFTEDMLPKYFNNRLYPLDIHSYATSIVLLSRIGEMGKARRVLENALERMFHSSGYWYFQEHKHYTIRIPYMRWSVAWMAYALSHLLLI